MNFCICGGGSLGHVIAGYLGANADVRVSMLTQRPQLWKNDIEVHTPEQTIIHGHIHTISSNPEDVIPQANIILLCLPGFAIKQQLQLIKPYVKSTTFVGSVFSSTGFFFNAMEILNEDVPLWGFQRVPFICRTREYGQSANLLGYKSNLNIAVERTDEKEDFRLLIEKLFNTPVSLLNNFYEATLTNSNPLLHTSRLYTMFGASNEGRTFPRMILFYEEWTEEAAQLLIDMDEEFFRLLEVLPVKPNYLPRILEYYESHDARSLAQKLSSIQGFKGITSPMKQTAQGWIPDFASRYFTEDFPYGLHFIWQLAKEKGIATPKIDMVYQWGMSKI
ncbi:MAG: NAD/NADP octopine/nopaline dehydrogenase family protein [Bacteroidaceae bacterium]|nr:NAD/NADP octopine/nopaline dehydrogenase family protein [Bacteroidaceae bacterium]MBQ5694774.1 NAD/NADP octopine/nopaline dehydrogenase family protein [Bacteroidaceae bacterium]